MTYTREMARGTVRLKGRELIEKHGVTMYRVAKDGDLSYGTVHRIVTDESGNHGFSAETLYSFLVGLGLTEKQVADMRIGDVFDLVADE